MDTSSLFLKQPAAARFVTGGLPEAEALLGSPLPLLPPTEAGQAAVGQALRESGLN